MNSQRTNRETALGREVYEERIASRGTAHSPRIRKAQRPVKVMKFGGTSVGNANCIRQVIDIIRAESVESDVVVIVSAMSGVTNKLIQAANDAASGSLQQATQILENLRLQHQATLEALLHAEHSRQLLSCRIRQLLTECNSWCESTARAGELTLAAQDLISGLGERLSAPLLASVLAAEGTPAEAIEATELIVTTSQHGAADPLMEATRERSETRLRFLLQNGVTPVITGFIGGAPDGALTTLGRGGSDYSATILGAALDADEVIIWTDVDGMLTADPRSVPEAVTIPEISYREAAELAYFGAKVLHPKTLDPVVRQGIPVWIRNTFVPGSKGTRITSAVSETDTGVKALTAIHEAAMIIVNSSADILPDIGRRILSTVAAIQADVLMISQAALANQVRLVVARKFARPVLEMLRSEFESDLKSGDAKQVYADVAVAILTVVGQNLEAVNGIVRRSVEELARKRVNVIATGQRTSDCSVSFVVSSDAIGIALSTTHRILQARSMDFASSGQQLYRSANALVSRSNVVPNELRRGKRAAEQGVPVYGYEATEDSGEARACVILDEVAFGSMIALERKRTERSRKPMLLMLLDAGNSLPFDKSGRVLSNMLSALSLSTRDTDVTGWYKDQSVVGVMFTEISLDDHGEILSTMIQRVSQTMRNNLTLEKFSQISISMHVFPEAWSNETSQGNPAFYPDLAQRELTH